VVVEVEVVVVVVVEVLVVVVASEEIPPPLFYPFGREGSGTSLGLVPDAVTSLYTLGCVLSANICFRNGRDHGKTSKLLGFVTP